MSRGGQIDADNKPCPRVVESIKRAAAGVTLASQVRLRDMFSPEALQQQEPSQSAASDIAGEQMGVGNEPSSTCPPSDTQPTLVGRPSTVQQGCQLSRTNFKGELVEKASSHWKSTKALEYSTRRVDGTPDQKPLFQATVTFLLAERHVVTGAHAPNKKAVEQSASQAALPFMNQLLRDC